MNLIKKSIDNNEYKELIKFILNLDSYAILNSIKDKKSKLIKSTRIIIQNLENRNYFKFIYYQYKKNFNILIDKSLYSPTYQLNLIIDFLKIILITNRKHNIIFYSKRNKLIFNDIMKNSGENFNLKNRILLKI